jgi:hypothetical protein
MEKPDMNRRSFLEGLTGVALGSVVGSEAIAREPDITRDIGPMLQFGTYFDFVARFNKEQGLSIVPIALRSGDTLELQLKNVNGNDVDLPILSRPATEDDGIRELFYHTFRERLFDYVRQEL